MNQCKAKSLGRDAYYSAHGEFFGRMGLSGVGPLDSVGLELSEAAYVIRRAWGKADIRNQRRLAHMTVLDFLRLYQAAEYGNVAAGQVPGLAEAEEPKRTPRPDALDVRVDGEPVKVLQDVRVRYGPDQDGYEVHVVLNNDGVVTDVILNGSVVKTDDFSPDDVIDRLV